MDVTQALRQRRSVRAFLPTHRRRPGADPA